MKMIECGMFHDQTYEKWNIAIISQSDFIHENECLTNKWKQQYDSGLTNSNQNQIIHTGGKVGCMKANVSLGSAYEMGNDCSFCISMNKLWVTN